MTVNAVLPKQGFAGIRKGQVYERALFSDVDLKALLKVWRIRPGTVKDPGTHHNTEILQFVSKREG